MRFNRLHCWHWEASGSEARTTCWTFASRDDTQKLSHGVKCACRCGGRDHRAIDAALLADTIDMDADSQFKIYPISQLTIMYPVPDAIQRHGSKSYRAIANGSFLGGNMPTSPVMIAGSLKTVGCDLGKTAHRGCLAVLNTGEVVVGRMQFKGAPSGGEKGVESVIQSSFGKPVTGLMAGGALLIENGKHTVDLDSKKAQHFDQGGSGIGAGQMRTTNHVAVATRGGKAFLVIALKLSGEAIRAHLDGYDAAVMFDGGRQFWAHLPGWDLYVGPHPLGLAVN